MDISNFYWKVGFMLDRIIALLKENGITAKKLTSNLEISNSSVSDWKKGSKPSCDVVVKLAKYFGVSTDYILLGERGSGYFKTISPTSAWCAVGISRWIEGVHKMFKTTGRRYCQTS